MGDAWGGDVSAYRREGEVELGPTTWLYFDSGCAPHSASALGAARRFPFQPRIWSVSLAAKRAVPCVSIQLTLSQSLYKRVAPSEPAAENQPAIATDERTHFSCGSQFIVMTVPHRALRAHPAAGSPSGTPAPPAPGSSRSSVIETLWPYLHPACRLGVIPVALMAIVAVL